MSLSNELQELQNNLAELLKTSSGKKELERLLGIKLPEEPKERKERSKIPLTIPPSYVLRVRHVCNLCKSTTFEFFLMSYDTERKGYVSKTLQRQNYKFLDIERVEVLEKVLETSSISQWLSPTLVSVPAVFEKIYKTYPVKNQRSVLQTCKVCSTVLSFWTKDELILKLIQRSNKLGETAEYVKTLTKLHGEGLV